MAMNPSTPGGEDNSVLLSVERGLALQLESKKIRKRLRKDAARLYSLTEMVAIAVICIATGAALYSTL